MPTLFQHAFILTNCICSRHISEILWKPHILERLWVCGEMLPTQYKREARVLYLSWFGSRELWDRARRGRLERKEDIAITKNRYSFLRKTEESLKRELFKINRRKEQRGGQAPQSNKGRAPSSKPCSSSSLRWTGQHLPLFCALLLLQTEASLLWQSDVDHLYGAAWHLGTPNLELVGYTSTEE